MLIRLSGWPRIAYQPVVEAWAGRRGAARSCATVLCHRSVTPHRGDLASNINVKCFKISTLHLSAALEMTEGIESVPPNLSPCFITV
jgi:hypothetical protein